MGGSSGSGSMVVVTDMDGRMCMSCLRWRTGLLPGLLSIAGWGRWRGDGMGWSKALCSELGWCTHVGAVV